MTPAMAPGLRLAAEVVVELLGSLKSGLLALSDDAGALDPAVLDPVVLDPMVLDPVVLDPDVRDAEVEEDVADELVVDELVESSALGAIVPQNCPMVSVQFFWPARSFACSSIQLLRYWLQIELGSVFV